MADTKVSAYTANTAPIGSDILLMVDDPGGTPLTQKVTFTNAGLGIVTLTTWSPTLTGWSANPANGVYRYALTGKLCTLFIRQPTAGTSNNTATSMTLPFTAATITNHQWIGYGQGIDNGSTLTTFILAAISSAGTSVTFYTNAAGAAWTNSGNKYIAGCTITYETA